MSLGAPDVGWACLASSSHPRPTALSAKPPDCEDVRTPWCLQHARRRTGCRHTHPTAWPHSLLDIWYRASPGVRMPTGLRALHAPTLGRLAVFTPLSPRRKAVAPVVPPCATALQIPPPFLCLFASFCGHLSGIRPSAFPANRISSFVIPPLLPCTPRPSGYDQRSNLDEESPPRPRRRPGV